MPSSPRSLAKLGSSVGYGRYSSTSRAQRAASGMPAASNAAVSSATEAVLASTTELASVAVEAVSPAAVVSVVAAAPDRLSPGLHSSLTAYSQKRRPS